MRETEKKEKTPIFQALFLDNGRSDDVNVLETEEIDFEIVQQHLMQGGSIFITSKKSQKVRFPRKAVSSRRNTSTGRSVAKQCFDCM